jgi:multidrug efflux pump subunit AcrB
MPSCSSIRSTSSSHADWHEAIIMAPQKRLRPILLTSATTVLGLAPMAVAGGALRRPMAVLMMSGLAVASLLTLLFVAAGLLRTVSVRSRDGWCRV